MRLFYRNKILVTPGGYVTVNGVEREVTGIYEPNCVHKNGLLKLDERQESSCIKTWGEADPADHNMNWREQP